MTDETDLRLYPVEHDLRGLSAALLASVHRAPGPAVVRAVNDIAQFPLARIIAVLSSAPDASRPLADQT